MDLSFQVAIFIHQPCRNAHFNTNKHSTSSKACANVQTVAAFSGKGIEQGPCLLTKIDELPCEDKSRWWLFQ